MAIAARVGNRRMHESADTPDLRVANGPDDKPHRISGKGFSRRTAAEDPLFDGKLHIGQFEEGLGAVGLIASLRYAV